jgi:hypothetical protein
MTMGKVTPAVVTVVIAGHSSAICVAYIRPNKSRDAQACILTEAKYNRSIRDWFR